MEYKNRADLIFTFCENVNKYGGSFAKSLGESLMRADQHNQKRIIAAFPELWNEYTGLDVERKKEKEKTIKTQRITFDTTQELYDKLKRIQTANRLTSRSKAVEFCIRATEE